MKALILSILVALAIAEAGAISEDEIVQITGVLAEQVFPGRPNYESTATGDEPERVWILTTTEGDRRQCYQLVVIAGDESTFAALRRGNGNSVLITGAIWNAETGHHHTDQLITVRSVAEVPNH